MTQKEKLKTILQDGLVHTVPELIKLVYGLNKPSSARLAARVYDLRQDGYEIISNPETATKWWYQMVIKDSTKWKKTLVERKRGNSKRVKQLN